jgi:L-2-hydroxyglutarate oxidase
MLVKYDVIIIGAGVIGFSIGIALLDSAPSQKILILEKESSIGRHASGRNSGVLHAGFYYSPESLKAKFCSAGNKELRILANKYGVPIRETGKIVVSKNKNESVLLESLFERGIQNGVDLELINSKFLSKYEPLAISNESFLWSPKTAISDPTEILNAMRAEFEKKGGHLVYSAKVKLSERNGEVKISSNNFESKLIVNAAGAQADRLSRSVGVGMNYAMLPFIGLYRSANFNELPLQKLVYPVPNPKNPFLGVHFTLTLDSKVKIGPTALPIFGREQYTLFSGWSSVDVFQAIKGAVSLFHRDPLNFINLIRSELSNIFENEIVRKSARLVPAASDVSSWNRMKPGIRAQLVNLNSGELEQDYVILTHLNSTHVLNAVSPGWTSSLPFGRFIAEKYLNNF